ncbi:hypothetical protein PNA2_1400 [Pyrococcus sp. NA2]|uniref:hypothetical protein n=1 Tax=Pyrococcus sp. (strain NA2) TaxID=342949 RepID=UPI000209AEAD|nr:hypothetical protein [Pyrococcus sp. NA2]AEC52315.1 hypothetical protein PNA2_1400 [Pyrococcus sp. NA2]
MGKRNPQYLPPSIVVDEKKLQEEFVRVLNDIKKSYRLAKTLIDVTTSWSVGGRTPDITVFFAGKPLLIIELKRAIDYSPWNEFPIGQVYTYALLAKKEGYTIDFVATANEYLMAFFRVPDDLEKYANWEAIRKRKYNRAFEGLYWRAKYGDLYIGYLCYLETPPKKLLYRAIRKLIEGVAYGKAIKLDDVQPSKYEVECLVILSTLKLGYKLRGIEFPPANFLRKLRKN